MPDLCYVSLEDRIVPLEEARVPVLDRGFLFADGVYEFIRTYEGVPFYFEEHLHRLRRSLAGIRIPFTDFDRIRHIARELLKKAGYPESKIYIQITRGVARRDHPFPRESRPTLVMTVEELDDTIFLEWQRQGVQLITVPDMRWRHCDLKTIMLLPNVLAIQQAIEAGAYDALLVGEGEKVRETTRNSFFAICQGHLVVPPVDGNVLPGITRSIVLHLASQIGLPVALRDLHLREAMEAEEAFVTGTTIGIVPVTDIDGKRVGSAKPGPWTRKLQQAFDAEVKQHIARVRHLWTD
jgi:D-alanine transaminase